MKKLTWALLSLMLFLGLGVAFAQNDEGGGETSTETKLPSPTFTPENNATIPANSTITVTMPDDLDLSDYMDMAFLLYTTSETVELETTVQTLYGLMNPGGTPPAVPYEYSYYYDGEWMMPVIFTPDDPEDNYSRFRARLVVIASSTEEGDYLIYSDEEELLYIIGGEAEELAMPTFNPADGSEVDPGTKVTITAEGADEIWYCIDCEDADLTMNGYMAGKCSAYGLPISIRKAQTIKAVSVGMGASGPSVFSDVATASYTVTDKEQTDIPKLTVTPAGPISIDGSATFSCALDPQEYTHTSGKVGFGLSLKNGADVTKLEFQVGTEINPESWTAYAEQALNTLKGTGNPTLAAIPTNNSGAGGREIAIEAKTVHYRLTLAAGATTAPEVKFEAVEVNDYGNWPTTDAEVLAEVSVKFEIAAPAITVAQPVITPDGSAGHATIKLNQKVTIECATTGASIYYTLDGTAPDNTKTLYEAPFLLPDNTPVGEEITIRAIAILNGVSSDARRVALMVEAAGEGPDDPTPPTPVAKPDAPKFKVNGEAVTASTLEVSATPAEVAWIGEPNESSMVIYTLDGSEDVFDVTSAADFDDDATNYWYFGDEAIDVKVPVTIKAKVAAMDAMGAITWSDMTTLALTLAEAPSTKPAAPTFSPASGATVDFGAELTISCADEDAWIIYTTDGSEPSVDNDNVHYYNDYFKAKITATTIKAVSYIYDGDDVLYSDVVTATYTFNPITATLSLVPVKEDTVGMNVGTGIEFSIDGWEEYPGVAVYYTVDGTTEPSKTAYEAQSDKVNGAIKKLTVETREYEDWGETYTEVIRTDGHALAIMFKESTHLKAIGYITVLGEEVATSLLDETLQVKSEAKPVFSLADGAEVTLGSKLVIENPNPYPERPAMPEDWDDEEAVEAYYAALDEYDAAVADIPATIMYFSFDGTQPTSTAYDQQPDDNWSVFKTQEGQDVSIFFRKDEKGYYAYVPEILGYFSPADTLRLGADVSAFTMKAMAVTTESEEGEGGGDGPAPLSAKIPGEAAAFMYGSDFAVAEYKVVAPAAATLTFNPASGSEIEENTAVAITANQNVEIFYMMFESEAAAKAAAWDQEKAESYSSELKPVPTKEKNTIKAAYAYEGSDIVEPTFFYATYTVKELPAIELTFNPASGSEVEDNTTVTVTANREVEIFYNLYADKAAADADKETFMANAKEVAEDGMPVITKAAPYLRCAVTDRGEMKYIDATYTVRTANEDEEELAGVSVYPNPSNGMFNLELPVAATVEVFASNGVLVQRMKLGEGNATLNIERSGIYFLRITGEGRTTVKRLIVR